MTSHAKALLVVLAVFATNVDADESDVSTLDASLVRASYVNTPALPDGVAFTHLVGLLSSIDEETATEILQSELGINAEKSAKLLNRTVEEYERLHAAIAAANVEKGCIAGVPRVYGDEVYPVLEAMDDDAEKIGSERLAKFLKETDPNIADRLMRWIRTEKTNISYLKFDHKELYHRTGYSGDVALAAICNSLEGFGETANTTGEAR